MARPGPLFTLLYGVLFELQLVTMVTSESRGDEFKMEPGELELLYDETLDHYVIQIEQNQVRPLRHKDRATPGQTITSYR